MGVPKIFDQSSFLKGGGKYDRTSCSCARRRERIETVLGVKRARRRKRALYTKEIRAYLVVKKSSLDMSAA